MFPLKFNFYQGHLQVHVGEPKVKPVPCEGELDGELLGELVDVNDVDDGDAHVHHQQSFPCASCFWDWRQLLVVAWIPKTRSSKDECST